MKHNKWQGNETDLKEALQKQQKYVAKKVEEKVQGNTAEDR
jgi:hypothetical protein